MKHDVAKKLANETVLKEVDNEHLDQRILAVVAISDAGGKVDTLARSVIWLGGDCCSPRMFAKLMCAVFRPEL